jgi:hypothetical protein
VQHVDDAGHADERARSHGEHGAGHEHGQHHS